MANRWIQKLHLKKGRVEKYIKRTYGKKAFNKDGSIKMEYLEKAKNKAKSRSLKSAIILAIRLKKLR